MADIFKPQRSPFEPVNIEELELVVDEELMIECEKQRVKNEMIELLTNAIVNKYSCPADDVYKYWDEFKKGLGTEMYQ